jgi:DEAD/DEAH box helicase domain-containing protein
VAFTAALTTLHEKAIYLHEGRLFHVERFDYAERKAYVRQVECDYYTDAIDYTQVKILESFAQEPVGPAVAEHGEVRINRQIVGFKKIKFYTNENVGAGKLSMPEQEMHTTAFWLSFPAEFLRGLNEYTPTEKQNGVSGLGNVLRTVGAVLLMADPRDLGVAVGSRHQEETAMAEPDLFLYDVFPGGIGQSEPLFNLRVSLLEKARELLGTCPCEEGCPSCVGAPGEAGDRAKEVALRLVEFLLGARELVVAAAG